MQIALLATITIVYFIGAFCWPIWRSWQRYRIFPVVFLREAAPLQRAAGIVFFLLFLGLNVMVVLAAAIGPEQVGIRPAASWAPGLGWPLLLSGVVLTVVAQRQMGRSFRIGIDDRPTELVYRGLFRLCRNPIFTGLLPVVGGITLLCPAWRTIGGFLATATALRIQVHFEERHLMRLHGTAYLAYASRVGRFFPFVGRLNPAVIYTGRS